MEGVWSMTEEGEFVLSEPYATMLEEAKLVATKCWRDGLIGYLEPRCPYDAETLRSELLRRNRLMAEEGLEPMGMVEEFVIEALTGDLLA